MKIWKVREPDFTVWRRWFAWYPVPDVSSKRWVWLENVWYKENYVGTQRYMYTTNTFLAGIYGKTN